MMDLMKHANAASTIKRAALFAKGIADNLNTINDGVSSQHDREKLVGDADAWFLDLAECLGHKVEVRS